MLQALAAIVDRAADTANNKKEVKSSRSYFVSAGQASNIKCAVAPLPSLLDGARDWEVAADLPDRREYPKAVRDTGMRPDIVVHSEGSKEMVMIELTVPYESRIEEQHRFKSEKYSDVAKKLKKDAGIRARVIAVEVGARGFATASAYDLCKQLGLKGQARARAVEEPRRGGRKGILLALEQEEYGNT